MVDWQKAIKRIGVGENEINGFDKIKLMSLMVSMTNYGQTCNLLRKIAIHGYVREKKDFSVSVGNGNSYVYLWKHILGNVFYVGSGINDRYKSKNRGKEFLEELDRADVVVYFVATDMDRNMAYKLERYVSGVLSYPIPLTNHDNRITEKNKDDFIAEIPSLLDGFDENTRKQIENAIGLILSDDDFTYRERVAANDFIDEYGSHYFSSGEYKEYDV